MHNEPPSFLHVFSFSGFIILDTGSQLEPCEFSRRGIKIIVEPPLRLSPPTWRPIPQFDEDSLKELIPAAPPVLTPLRISTFPVLGGGDGRLAAFAGDEGIEKHLLPRDTLVVHVYNAGIHSQTIAESVESDLLTWLRVLSLQWWIGMPSEHITGHLHLSMRLAGYREIDGRHFVHTRQVTADPLIQPVDALVWKDAIGHVAQNAQADVDEVLFLDA